MNYKTYPVPPPKDCEWDVWLSESTGRIVIDLYRAGKGWRKPMGSSTLRPSSRRARNEKRIMDKMVIMVLEYEIARKRREKEDTALEGLLGEFK